MASKFRQYCVLDRLAVGGMATLDRVTCDEGSERESHYVLKRLLPTRARNVEWRAMFHHEIEVTSSMRHENCIKVYESGEHDGELYMVLEEVSGPHLGQLFGAGLRRHKPLPVEICVEILRQLALALAHLHRWEDGPTGANWRAVHRDVCPQNTLIGDDGRVTLIDFGLAYTRAAPATLGPEVVRGRPGYMSPEQCMGQAIDPRSDVFAWGIVAYEVLSRSRLFRGASAAQQMAENARAQIVPLRNRNPGVVAELAELVHATLMRDRQRRAFCLHEVSQALSAWQQAQGHPTGAVGLASWLQASALMVSAKTREVVLSSPTPGEP